MSGPDGSDMLRHVDQHLGLDLSPGSKVIWWTCLTWLEVGRVEAVTHSEVVRPGPGWAEWEWMVSDSTGPGLM